MSDFRPFARLLLAGALLGGLAGCDTLGMSFGPSAPSGPAARPIDYRNDDLSAVLFAIDVPVGLKPVAGGTVATFDATNGGKADKHVRATLVLADGEAVDAALPPPASGRTSYLFTFGEKDKAAIRAAQKWLQAQPTDSAPVVLLDVAPKLCATAAPDPTMTYNVVPALAGTPLTPIVSGEAIGQLPACAG